MMKGEQFQRVKSEKFERSAIQGPIIGGRSTVSLKDHKILPVFVTIDPQRDTPSHLRAYLNEFDPDK
ncbi:hypothetical protein HAX54_019086 [Datura stramonium]|uniref:Uncharacterized protein n=1 Tax=Datura stramonium TaxID=4076 RepID=A0ABS8UR94_DATST|nr:hypothetical protein [Datura stramonium]